MTQSEAMDEAVKRWGPGSWAMRFPVAKMYGMPEYEVGGPEGSGINGAGDSFESALLAAGGAR